LLRRRELKFEIVANVVGTVFLLAVPLLLTVALRFCVEISSQRTIRDIAPENVGAVCYAVLLAVCGVLAGRSVRALRASARMWLAVPSALLLLAFPIGTLIGGSLLCLLATRRAKYVFSSEYRAVVARSPHMGLPAWAAWLAAVLICMTLLVISAAASVGWHKFTRRLTQERASTVLGLRSAINGSN
jgi:hypothetical protein